MGEPIESLRESVRTIGPLFPLYRFKGEDLDGRRRAQCCSEVGRVIPISHIDTEEAAAALLWKLHPERAMKRWPCSSASEACERFQARLVEVRSYFQPPAPKYAQRRNTGARSRFPHLSEEPVQIKTWAALQLREQVKEAAQAVGLSAAEFQRGALYSAVQDPERVRSIMIARSIARR